MRLRKNQSDAIDGTTGEAGADKQRRRGGRGWGPFSGGQLTIIVVAFAVMMLLPVGAWALSFTNVAITDPGGVNQAQVDSGGKLLVGDGEGPIGIDGHVNVDGGTVAASPALPTKPITITNTPLPTSTSGSPAYKTIYGPQSEPFGIGSLTFTSCTAPPPAALRFPMTVSVRSHLSTGGTFVLFEVKVPSNETVHFGFPIPLVLTPGTDDPVRLEVGTTDPAFCGFVSGVGFQS